MSDESNWQNNAKSKQRDAVSDAVNKDSDEWIIEEEYEEK
jgi:hypothetical protein